MSFVLANESSHTKYLVLQADQDMLFVQENYGERIRGGKTSLQAV